MPTTSYVSGENETIDDSIARVKENLGGRENGYIGNTKIDDAVFNALQEAQNSFLQKYDPLSLRRSVYKEITATDRDVLFTRLSENGLYFEVKSIIDVRCREHGETDTAGTRVLPMTDQGRIRRYSGGPEYTEQTGWPKYYVWKKVFNDWPRLELYPYPDQAYDINCSVNVYPAEVTLGTELSLDHEWVMTMEALATSICFYKLQELESGSFWRAQYLEISRRVAGEEHRQATAGLRPINGGSQSHEATDPFVYNNEAPQW